MLILNVATQPIKTEYNAQNASLSLETIPSQLNIDTEAAKIEIKQPKGELQIDQTPCRYAYGIKNTRAFSSDNAQLGRSAALEAIDRLVAEGNRMARIESKENVIAEIAADTNTSPVGELTLAYIPLPDISYQQKLPQMNFIAGKCDIDYQKAKVNSTFHPGTFDINVNQYPNVKMWTSENKVDLMM